MSTVNETYSLDDQIIGVSYMIFAVISTIIYVPCLVVIRTDSELKEHSCLRIMFYLGISDLLHVTGLAICGFLSVTGYAYTIPLCNVWNERLFGKAATTKWIILCWFLAFCWLAYHLSPWGGFIYYPKIWVLHFDHNTPFVKWEALAVLTNCIIHICSICFWCTLAVIGFKKQLSELFHDGSSQLMREKERSLLIQSVAICAVLIMMDLYWHNFQWIVNCVRSVWPMFTIQEYFLFTKKSEQLWGRYIKNFAPTTKMKCLDYDKLLHSTVLKPLPFSAFAGAFLFLGVLFIGTFGSVVWERWKYKKLKEKT